MELAEIQRAHAARLAAIDPLLPVPAELTGDVLVVGTAAGALRVRQSAPDSYGALWGALERHSLTVRLADANLDPLLDAWEQRLRVAARHNDREVAAVVTWPSRDVDGTGALAMRGFAPLVVTAIRPADAVDPPVAANDVVIRDATPADLATCVALSAAVVRYDALFGLVTARPGFEDRMRNGLGESLRAQRGCVWLAERARDPVGVLVVEFAEQAGWIAGSTSATPIGYIGVAGVAPGARGRGVGGALVAHGHRMLARAGVAATLLHHALANPRSTPFWYRHGYRPLWTTWQRRPAVRS